MSTAVAHALDTMRLHRLGLQVYPFDPRAIRVHDKCGFRHDALEMSILRTDPRP